MDGDFIQPSLSIGEGYWTAVKDGDRTLAQMYRRHYSCYDYKDGRRDNVNNHHRFLTAGPGFKLCLLGKDGRAGFVWRIFKSDDGQSGINCAWFRNEGDMLSSGLILEAERLALAKWPEQTRFYTYVDAQAVKSSIAGYCFRRAKWRRCGTTKVNKLVILEKNVRCI